MRLPVNSPHRVTLKYGATTSPYSASNKHNGVDLVSDDWKLLAPEAGTVTYFADTKGKSGWMMVLQGSKRHSFSHLVAGSSKVPVNSKVSEGQHLATIGDTGFATGRHLHWVVNSGAIDPMSLINKEEDMVTKYGVDLVWRSHFGRAASQSDYDRYVGKVTLDQLAANARASAEYKSKVEAAKAGKLSPENHLLSALRSAYVPPAAPAAKELAPGLYKVA